MMKRTFLTAVVLTFLLVPGRLFAQGAGGGGDKILGLPIIECTISSSADQLFFEGNDYNPNRITVTVTVENIGETGSSPADTAVARGLSVSVTQDTRFIIVDGLSIRPIVNPVVGGDSLRYGESASVTFEFEVASPRSSDGIDVISAVVISQNANHTTCDQDIWVEHEYYPDYQIDCQAEFQQIIWDENIDDYSPNPFTISVDVTNIGDGASDSTLVVYIGTPDVSLYEADEEEKFLDVLQPSETKSVSFQLRPVRRNNDTTVNVCFQVRGIGGYKRKYYIDSCCVAVFIPAAKQPVYELTCSIDSNGVPVDFISFIDHKYTPDPFEYNVTVTNTGTALGKDVKAKILLPPSINLAPGETDTEKSLGDIPTGQTRTVSWLLSPTRLFERDTLCVNVRVYDAFSNQATCEDCVIVDSIRRAIFDVTCACPDTIYADQQQGVYTNSPFDVFFTVSNVGSDYADSLCATILIQNPILKTVTGFSPVQCKAALVGTDSLSTNNTFQFTWPLEAFATAVGQTVRIKFTAKALNAEPVDCVCEVYVQRLDAPNLDVTCETVPIDSLHFDPETGGYTPPFITMRVRAVNIGGGIARNVKGTLSIPARMILQTGETPEQNFPRDLGPNDTAWVEWHLIPVKRTDFGSIANFCVEVTAENVVERPVVCCPVFVPALPNTAALAIPRNGVGYTNQTILVPIFIDDPQDKDIKKFEMEIYYNFNEDILTKVRTRMPFDVLEFNEVILTNSLTGNWSIVSQSRNPANDQLNFTIESTVPLAYPANVPDANIPPLVWLSFRAAYGPPSTTPFEDYRNDYILRSPILWPEKLLIEERIRINDGSIFPRVTPGEVMVSGDCLRPLMASPDYVLYNKPNPFNPSTTIEYAVPVDEHVKITVFDALGREVKVLVDGFTQAGSHQVLFEAKGLTTGIYFYRMETPNFSTMRKMVVAK
ncbi:MAG: hypothetical protein C0600_09650 [Ignavibacteria bacterium]|nr:MAG: hypothetical protein C0600_09650 [Ignavibacteria bacterium]